MEEEESKQEFTCTEKWSNGGPSIRKRSAVGVGDGPESQKYQPRKWSEDCWARIFSWFREYDLQRKESMQERKTEEEEIRRQQRMKTMADMTRKKGRMDAKKQLVGQ